jgi:hypothetical protein
MCSITGVTYINTVDGPSTYTYRPGVVPRRKDGPPTTHQETKYAHFLLMSNWLFLCINITYIQLNLSNRNINVMFIYRVYKEKVIELQHAIVPELLGV